ncbi:hypothetical protein [Sphingobacterium bambusae]|uniref:Outer membrane protein beta-barrel domain-containing protein n=1 Tax=Sphingobacterium bambusae TaxID=662858 RepID=A0ABW6BMD4_9SPHI|nr:hypothetical protein [Sphingobacterium bambusae]WPL47937.1 hypothetical protein SCB77_18470 [Sphingobacterium bambusae]
MKQTFVCFFIASVFTLGISRAQQTKFLIEVGGNYQKTNYETDDINYLASNKQLTTTIQPRLGVFVGKHTVLGLSYDFQKQKGEMNTKLYWDSYRSSTEMDIDNKTHGIGTFYRHYFRAVYASRWNVFLELNPSYQTSKQLSALTRMDQTNGSGWDNPMLSVSQYLYTTRQKAVNVGLKAGTSYRLSKFLHLQLTLPSIAHVNHMFHNEENDIEYENSTNFSLFSHPLSNSSLSLLFTL